MDRLLDLRSDTVTTPTREMREAMYRAEVGDDVMGEDPTVRALEEMGAALFGKEDCVFTCSGTMSNQVAALTLCGSGKQVVLHDKSHMYNLEVGALARICGMQARPVPAPGGRFDLGVLAENLVPGAIQTAPTGLVCMENSFDLNRGLAIGKEHIDQVCALSHGKGVPVYMDGARVLNAALALDLAPALLCRELDAVSLCLSKALACPVGSLLAGSRDFTARARQMRQMLGGGWRQAGVIAAAGVVALRDWRALGRDHEKAALLARGLKGLGLEIDLEQVQTNIVRIDTSAAALTGEAFCRALAERGVKAKPVEPHAVRMICHKDIRMEDIPLILRAVEQCLDGEAQGGRIHV